MPLIEGERIECRCGRFVVVSEEGAFHEGEACEEFKAYMLTLNAEDKGIVQAAVVPVARIIYGICPACGRDLYVNESCDCRLSVDTN